MKLIIDIPEEVLKTRYYTDYFGCGSHKLTETLDNATSILDNATNGDLLKAIFPNTVFAEDKYEDDGTTWVDIISDDGMTFEMDFWNASYKAERKDNNE